MFVISTVFMPGSSSLRMLYATDNPFGDDGMSLILGELQYNKVMAHLYISSCGLSEKGINS